MIRRTVQIEPEADERAANEPASNGFAAISWPAAKSASRPKVGVVLGSGGIKAFAGIPLIEFLDRAGVAIDLLVGCSGGSVVCGFIGAGFTPTQCRELAFKVLDRRLFERIDYRSVIGIASPLLGRFDKTSAILKPDAIRELYQRELKGARLENMRPRTLIQTTDLVTGEGVVLSRGPAADAIYASGAFFPVLPPLYIDGRWLADGVYSSPVPVMEAVKRNIDVIIALDIKERASSEPQGFLDCFYRYSGSAMETLKRSQMLLSIEMHHYEIIVIQVEFDHSISLRDVDELPAILAAGEEAVNQSRDAILAAIQNYARASEEGR